MFPLTQVQRYRHKVRGPDVNRQVPAELTVKAFIVMARNGNLWEPWKIPQRMGWYRGSSMFKMSQAPSASKRLACFKGGKYGLGWVSPADYSLGRFGGGPRSDQFHRCRFGDLAKLRDSLIERGGRPFTNLQHPFFGQATSTQPCGKDLFLLVYHSLRRSNVLNDGAHEGPTQRHLAVASRDVQEVFAVIFTDAFPSSCLWFYDLTARCLNNCATLQTTSRIFKILWESLRYLNPMITYYSKCFCWFIKASWFSNIDHALLRRANCDKIETWNKA